MEFVKWSAGLISSQISIKTMFMVCPANSTAVFGIANATLDQTIDSNIMGFPGNPSAGLTTFAITTPGKYDQLLGVPITNNNDLVILICSYQTTSSDTLTTWIYSITGTLLGTSTITSTGQTQLNPVGGNLYINYGFLAATSWVSSFGFTESKDVPALLAYLKTPQGFVLPLTFPVGSTSTPNI